MSVKLTETTKKGGCAAKLPAGELRKVLKRLQPFRPKNLILGTETLDDACLWDLDNGEYLIQTLDFFTPIVDDPTDFGRIAAANALSDVFAMGGRPITAMSILAFPTSSLPMEIIDPLMAGANEKLIEAKTALAGGHTIDDESLKFGFSVTGLVNKDRAWTNSGAQAGDVLILTKGLGTGTITSAAKKQDCDPSWLSSAINSMCLLNRAPELLLDLKVNAATDITGFGLAGHAMQMAEASQKTLVVETQFLPVISGAIECLRRGILNRAHHTNKSYVLNRVTYKGTIEESLQWLTVDPQTSGGLLLCVPRNLCDLILERLKDRFTDVAKIGFVEPPSEYTVRFV